MEKSLYRQIEKKQFENRLCSTLLRLNWLIAAAAAVPALFRIVEIAFTLATAFYFLILIVITVLSLFLFLLNEDFRALFNKNGMENISAVTERIKGVYSTLIPVLLAVCVIIFGLSVYLVFKADGKKRTAKIISAILSLVVTVFFSVTFFSL